VTASSSTGTGGIRTHLGDQFTSSSRRHESARRPGAEAAKDDLIYIPQQCREELPAQATRVDPEHRPRRSPASPTTAPSGDTAQRDGQHHYVRHLDRSKFDKVETSHVTMANYETGSHHCRIDIVNVPAGKGGGDIYVTPYDEVFYTMTGEQVFQIGRERETIKPNTYVYVPAGVPHTFLNTGSGAATHIQVQVPEGPRTDGLVPVRLD
jgi:mannose-6-phosphate isomerase-like protein (cupin superfamily)